MSLLGEMAKHKTKGSKPKSEPLTRGRVIKNVETKLQAYLYKHSSLGDVASADLAKWLVTKFPPRTYRFGTPAQPELRRLQAVYYTGIRKQAHNLVYVVGKGV